MGEDRPATALLLTPVQGAGDARGAVPAALLPHPLLVRHPSRSWHRTSASAQVTIVAAGILVRRLLLLHLR